MRWVGLVALIGDSIGPQRVVMKDLKEKNHLEDLVVNRKIILK